MSYNGSGTFNINTAGQPVVTGTVISSTAFNALTADLGTGLSTAITKDGQTVATARIPFAAGINSSLVTDATNTTTGSIITAGGVGIAKALFVGTTANIAGTTTLAGVTATSITDSGLTSGRVTFASTSGLLADAAALAWDGTSLSATKFAGALNGTVGATTPATGAFTTLSATGTTTVGGTAGGTLNIGASPASDSSAHIRMMPTNIARSWQIGVNTAVVGDMSFTPSTTNGGSTFTTPVVYINTAGLAVTGTLSSTTGATFATSSGNVLIGTASNANSDKLVVNGSVYQFQTANGSSASPVTNGGYLFGPDSATVYAGIRFVNQILSNNNIAMAFYTTSNAGSATEVGRFDGSGNLGIGVTSPACILDISGAAGGQIKFPATQNASANANTLDDYEEGTWTPTIAGNGTEFVGATYTARAGKYVKVGDVVWVSFDIDISATGAMLNSASVGGLPFAIPNSTDLSNGGGGLGYIAGIQQNYVYQSCYPQNNSNFIYIIGRTAASNTTAVVNASSFYANSTRLSGFVWYRTTV